MFSDDPNNPRNDLQRRLVGYGRYVRPSNTVRPSTPLQNDFAVAPPPPIHHPVVNPITDIPTAPVPLSRPAKQRRSLFSAIIDATVEVERVTRQSVQTVRHSFEPPHISALRSRRQKVLVRMFYGVGSVSFVAAMVLGAYAFTHSGNSKPTTSTALNGYSQPNPNDATRTGELPAENKPTTEDISTYLVAPQYPRYLRIPAINVQTRIRRLGIDSKGAVSTPNNINDAGWYDASVKPGDKDGASIIEGHVAGPTQHGVFWELNKLVYGDKIEVEKGSGQVITYTVTKTEKVPAKQLNMDKYLSQETIGQNDLKLITAAGKYNIVNGVYDTRLVVYAQQM